MKTNKGFTLVELIIVIAVIGVLAAILIPVFSNIIEKANAKSALSDARNSMEQVIIEGTENPAMPENILIIVRKAGKFYVYGFNRTSDDRLHQSPGNPFGNFVDVQALIAARSWNALQGDTAPDLNTAYTDHSTYGYFYLVPYSGGVSQEASVRGVRAAYEYPEISDPANALMTENMGGDVHIYHGVLTDKTNTEAQTQGVGSAAPAQTNAPTTPPETTTPSDPTLRTYHVEFDLYYYDGRPLSLNGSAVKSRMDRQLALGDNYVSAVDVIHGASTDFSFFLNANDGWMFSIVEYNTLTPLSTVTVHVDDVNQETVTGNAYVAVVRKPEAPSDNSQLNAGRYWLSLHYIDADSGVAVGLNPNVVGTEAVYICYDLDLEDTTYLPVADLIRVGKFPPSGTAGYHYEAVDRFTHSTLDYIEIDWTYEPQVLAIDINIYVQLVPNG